MVIAYFLQVRQCRLDEGIGLPLISSLPMIRRSMEELNFTFLFAPNFHPAFKHIAPVRKALAEGIITIFNLLSPQLIHSPGKSIIRVFNPALIKRLGKP